MVAANTNEPLLSEWADGIHPNVPAHVYHQRILGLVSKSALDELAKAPARYKAWIDGIVGNDSTPALEFGAAFHCALLEPERFKQTYVVVPDFGDCRKTENKTKRDEWRRENGHKQVLEVADAWRIKGMCEAVRSHALAGKMLVDGEAEQTILWTDEETGLKCKVRTDYLIRQFETAVDVKSTTSAHPKAFVKDVFRYGYHLQHALYRAGLAAVDVPTKHFVFIAVEKEPPYLVGVHALDDRGVRIGHFRVRELLTTMAECMKTREWPGYPEKIQMLETPPWAD